MKRFLSALLASVLVLSLCIGCGKPADPSTEHTAGTTTKPAPTEPVDYINSTVILYTANIRGDVTAYSRIAMARAHYEALGATVYLVDAGNYLQGSTYANSDMGLTVYCLMDAVGYDVAGMGVYDFVYGDATVGYTDHSNLVRYYTQAELYRGTEALTYQKNAPWHKKPMYATRAAKAAATFQVVCSNLQIGENSTGYYAFDASAVLGSELQVGFVSTLPESATGLLRQEFLDGYSFVPAAVPECDVLVSLGAGEGDIVIDIPADGKMTAGAYVIHNKTKAISFETVDLSKTNETLDGWIAGLKPASVIGTAEVDLDGSVQSNCNGQTALGTLVADALKWYAETTLGVTEFPVVGLFNGGNCTGFLYSGQITQLDIRNALHGSVSGVGVVYMTGAQLIETLEAATQRENCAGWAQVSGIDYRVDTRKPYDSGVAYGPYFKANSINRVSITTEGFDPAATYAVVADMLLLGGNDTYYTLRELEIVTRDSSGVDLCLMVEKYIQEVLQGQIKSSQQTLPSVSVTVTLNPNGGTCDSASVSVIQGQRYGYLPVPALEGYTFRGWFTAAEGGEQITEATVVTADADHTLYAQWEVKTRFTITLDANGGRISQYTNAVELKNGDTYGQLPQPIREGYEFLGWYTEPEAGKRIRSTTEFTEGKDISLYAHWKHDPMAYWTYILENRVQQIPECRKVVVYLERNAGYKTYIDCDFLNDAGAINPAQGLEEYKVTDAWIRSVEPYIIVKLTSDASMGLVSKTGMLRRFPDAEIYVFSTSAVSGSDKYQLYCRLYLAKLLYPEYFEDVDLETVKSQLNVKATIYY